MEFSFDFKMTEENKKVIEEILKQKGVKHYVLETKDKEKLDLVEYKDYKELEKEKQELIDYLKEEINDCPLIGDNDCDMFYIGKMRAYQEILSKIEKE